MIGNERAVVKTDMEILADLSEHYAKRASVYGPTIEENPGQLYFDFLREIAAREEMLDSTSHSIFNPNFFK